MRNMAEKTFIPSQFNSIAYLFIASQKTKLEFSIMGNIIYFMICYLIIWTNIFNIEYEYLKRIIYHEI